MVINGAITLFHYDESAEEYKYAFSLPASVLLRRSGEADIDGITGNNSAVIRIFTSEQLEMLPGDYVMVGICSELDKENALQISSVTDNRRGSPRVQHWRIDCGE